MNEYLVGAVLCLVIATAFTRFAPFLILGNWANDFRLKFVGRNLPVMVMPILVIYAISPALNNWPELGKNSIAVGVTAALHLWRRNVLLSIGAGTGCFVFLAGANFL